MNHSVYVSIALTIGLLASNGVAWSQGSPTPAAEGCAIACDNGGGNDGCCSADYPVCAPSGGCCSAASPIDCGTYCCPTGSVCDPGAALDRCPPIDPIPWKQCRKTCAPTAAVCRAGCALGRSGRSCRRECRKTTLYHCRNWGRCE